ncbi:MAG TPA: monooxygenase [Micromonosporaceae bacterium]|nr:monooxygenase [Micromonosporaceae bacterium]
MGSEPRWAAVVAIIAALLAGVGGEPDARPDRGPDPTPAGAAGHHLPHHATPVPAAPLRAGERFVTLTMPRPYTPAAPPGGIDEYRCFLVDPELTEPAFLTGSQFLPQNADIVHHTIFFRVAPDDVAEARSVDAGTPGDGWTCFGGTGIRGVDRGQRDLGAAGAWLAAWVPGSGETLLPPKTGYRLEPGTQVIMQVHYSLLATDGRPAGADRSGIQLRLAPGDADLDPLQVTLLPAPVELPCAESESGPLCDRVTAVRDVTHRFGQQSGLVIIGLNLYCNGGRDPVAGPRQHCDQPVRQDGLVYAVGGHMHLLGRSIRVELNPGTSRARVLLDVPVYNFDDQSARELPQPVAVRAGDILRVTCTHDASLRRRLPELRRLPPRYVVWGDGTPDEMCLGFVIWSRP